MSVKELTHLPENLCKIRSHVLIALSFKTIRWCAFYIRWSVMSIRDITLGRYIHGTSVLHRLDPRTKIFSLLVIMTGIITGNGWKALGLAAVYTIFVCFLSGITFSYLLRSIMPFKWLIIMTILLNVLFAGGHILIEAPLPYGGVTREGLELGILYGSRIVLLVLLASLLTLTTEPIVLANGVEKLLHPLSKIGLNPHEIGISMVITIRFIPILIDEATKIRKSHIARGLRPDGGMKVKLKSLSFLFLPLFNSAIRRAENLAVAMECRLYRTEMKRSHYKETTMAVKDLTVLVISVAFAVSIAVL